MGYEFEDIFYKDFGFYFELNGKLFKVFEQERDRGDELGNVIIICQVRRDG